MRSTSGRQCGIAIMELKIALCYGFMTLVAARTITIEKTSLSLSEDSEELDSSLDVLHAFLDHSDVTSAERLDNILQKCSKGKCEFCKNVLGKQACIVATLGTKWIVLELDVDKKQIIKTNITVADPPKICKKDIPGLKMLTDVCVQVKDVNLNEGSGCVYVSCKFYGKPFSFHYCFKIPHAKVENQEHQGLKVIQDGGTLVFEPVENHP